MNASPGELLWWLGTPWLLGCLVLRVIGVRSRDDRLAAAGWAWVGGCCAHAAALWLYVALGVESYLWWTAPLFTALVLLLLAVRRRPQPADVAPAPRGGRAFVVFALVGAAVIVVLIGAGGSRPCVEGDEASIWAMKAKSLLLDRGDFTAAQRHNPHPDYPLLNPLLQAWVMAQCGEVVHFANRLPVQAAALASWLVLCAALRRRLAFALAAPLAALVLVAAPFLDHCRLAAADGMSALGLLVAVDGLLRWRTSGAAGDKWMAALGAAFACWSKHEATAWIVVAGMTGIVGRAVWTPMRGGLSPRNLAAWLPIAAVAGLTCWCNWTHDLHNDLWGANPTGASLPALFMAQWPARASAVVAEFAAVAGNPAGAHSVLAVLLLSPLWCWRAAFGRELGVVTVALIGAVLTLHAVYVGSWLPLRQHLDTSYARVLFQLVPATLVWFAAVAEAHLRTPDSALHR